FPSLISSLSEGKALSSSRGPICVRTGSTAPRSDSPQSNSNTRGNGLFSTDRMAVIVAEFHAACKIETGDHHAFLTRQARRGSQAETTRCHAVYRPVRGQRLDTFLGQ